MSKKYHIARSGKHAGQQVVCTAKNCKMDSQSSVKETIHDTVEVQKSKINNLFERNKPVVITDKISNLKYLSDEQKVWFMEELSKVEKVSSQYKHDYDAADAQRMSDPDEVEFIKNYDPKKYTDKDESHTADNIIFSEGDDGKLKVLLIKRGGYPYKNSWAHPGGFIDPDEKTVDAALRELKEETRISLRPQYLQAVKSYDRPHRDPRQEKLIMHTHAVLIPQLPPFEGADDALEARLVNVEDIYAPNSSINMAFDHKQSIADAIKFLVK